jgi:hypothetical protein
MAGQPRATIAHSHGPPRNRRSSTSRVDGGTTDDAEGNILGTAIFRLVEHFTLVDREPFDPGPDNVVRIQFERGRLTSG